MSKAMNGATKIALLESRAVLRLLGPDRFTFLQGLISQDMQLAMDGKPLFAAHLTPQGKYLFDFFVVPQTGPQGDALLIDCDTAQLNELVKRLSFYKMRANVGLEDTRNQFSVFGLWGVASDHPQAFADPRAAVMGERLILSKDEANTITTNKEESDYREFRYKNGVAEGLSEIEVGQATLLEINFDALNAISWTKGCYVGQELTARMHYRALVKKRYLPFKYEGLPPVRHHDILHEGFAIGRVMAIGKDYGLGLFQLDKIRPFITDNTIVVHHGTTYDVKAPDYLRETIFQSANTQA
ncbi:MAG: folate-binding protein [Alphaproteobacteria bacterium]|nr:folate-binding protein [Alphaproteobacteria bacterium]